MALGLDVRVEGALPAIMANLGLNLKNAINAAIDRQTEETKGQLRVRIAGGLSARAANALRSKVRGNPDETLTGILHSAWWRAARGPNPNAVVVRGARGPSIDMLSAFERGDVIRPQGGRSALALPLPAAYDTISRRAGRRRADPTPVDIEAAIDADLFVLKRPGRPALLCAKNLAVTSKPFGSIRPARYRARNSNEFRKRRTANAIIPFFVLLRSTKLRSRYRLQDVREAVPARLAEKVLLEGGKRGVFG